ncbi:hypothetical protein HSBAA_20000 [Vreelandella sulfidaeris]|uniref:Uncharacterized protein n=1 Tax=Vreelandella sulfidaeris TaxID=115553 RepID=A0A455UBV0_9GAMM|nr:hypothetical protein HSBAA_20000 [Halomonas sulfidaeris]
MSSGGSNGLKTTRRDELAIKRPSNGMWQLDDSDSNKSSVEATYRWETKGTFSLARGAATRATSPAARRSGSTGGRHPLRG